jgi:hypothetical protein
MKNTSNLILLFLLLVSNSFIFSQGRKIPIAININVKVDTIKTRIYKKENSDENVKTLFLKMRYGDSEILNPKDAAILEDGSCNIISVEIVYTNYKNQDIQDNINRKRITELYFLNSNIFNQSFIQWKYIEQLGYSTEEDAKKLFHGIVINYIKMPSYKPESLKSMITDIKNKKKIIDTSLYKVFDKYINSKDELVCVDVTGSMTPYYLQVLVWLQLKNSSIPTNFSFFNDGDITPDYLKKIGNTGGIYLCKTNNIDTIISTVFNCISKGFGGDTPENNVEAALKGIKKYPETKEIIMLVDNWADMRDFSMISELKIPVRVIVCGTDYCGIKTSINLQYLELARKTGGSIHTIKEDIEDLAKKKEGEEILIGGDKFIVRSGKFCKK